MLSLSLAKILRSPSSFAFTWKKHCSLAKLFAFSQETLLSLKSFAKVLCLLSLAKILLPQETLHSPTKKSYFLAKVLRSPEKLCVCSQNICVKLKKDLHSLKKYCIHYLKSKNICVLTKYLHFPLQYFAKENDTLASILKCFMSKCKNSN